MPNQEQQQQQQNRDRSKDPGQGQGTATEQTVRSVEEAKQRRDQMQGNPPPTMQGERG
jgi:hypothetical protein